MEEKINNHIYCSPWRHLQRKKQQNRAPYRMIGFLVLIGGAVLKENYTGNQIDKRKLLTETQNIHLLRQTIDQKQAIRRIDIVMEESPCNAKNRVDNNFLLLLYGAGVLYTFVAIAIVCDEFFVPALEEIASEHYFNLSMDVAGATLMAAGGSAPELFTSLIGTFQGSEVGFGTIVGSAVFNVLFVIGMCAVVSKDVLTLTWWPLARDCAYYAVGLLMLAIFCGYISPGKIQAWEALVLFGLYIGYVVLMKYNEIIWLKIQNKLKHAKISDEQNKDKNDFSLGSGKVHFRAGLLNLFMGKGSLLDRVGIAMVTKISGDVGAVFRKLDVSGDGFLDNTEFRDLVESLGTSVDEEEITRAINDLDDNRDGKIDLKEFTKWYIKSEVRLRAELKATFDTFDADNSGTIDGFEMTKLMKELGTEVREDDIQATLEEARISGPTDQITYHEFQAWYTQSKYWDERVSKVDACTEEIIEPLWNHIKLPEEGGFFNILRWAFLLPLVSVLCLTIPDVRQPGNSRLCFFSFILSILWIGSFTYFMVMWAEVIGNTLGIPMVLMGLTILAAGTSVPDLLSSVIVARMGEGDMAVSSSIGSNIFDITIGLPIPWLLFMIYHKGEKEITIGTEGIATSIIILLVMIVCIVTMVHLSGWKMTKSLGMGMFMLYFIYLGQAIIRQLPLIACKS